MDYKQWKIIVVGEMYAGKSSIIKRISGDEFISNLKSTIGVDFALIDALYNGSSHRVCFWDIAGNGRFQALTNVFFRETNGIIIVYDITSFQSFEGVEKWFKVLKKNFGEDLNDIPILVLGNKCDLIEDVHTNFEILGVKFIEKNCSMAHFLKVSAKTREKIGYIVPTMLEMLEKVESKNNQPRIFLSSGESKDDLIMLSSKNVNKNKKCKCFK